MRLFAKLVLIVLITAATQIGIDFWQAIHGYRTYLPHHATAWDDKNSIQTWKWDAGHTYAEYWLVRLAGDAPLPPPLVTDALPPPPQMAFACYDLEEPPVEFAGDVPSQWCRR